MSEQNPFSMPNDERRPSHRRTMQAEAEPTVRLIAEDTPLPLRRLVWMLSVCLDTQPDSLLDLASRVWPDDHELVKWAGALPTWSFVEEAAEGWRLVPDLAPTVARRFREAAPKEFAHAHQILADIERVQLAQEDVPDDFDPNAEWFTRSRLAFYLAATTPADSVEEFGVAFETAPAEDAQTARMWLSTLVLRQEDLLQEYGRVVTFFEAFRAYVTNRRQQAQRLFGAVIAEGARDRYHAIAEHLLGVCLPVDERRLALLEASVDLSHHLGIVQNEVMARNSLVSTVIALAQIRGNDDPETQPRLRRARELALENLQFSREIDDKSYLAYTLLAYAIAEWLTVAGVSGARARSSEAHAVFDEVTANFREAVDAADRAQLSATALMALNQFACAQRDSGRYAEALETLEEAANRATPWSDEEAVTRLRKTVRSLERRIPASLEDTRLIVAKELGA
jgi:tetratricopeptide (TPR) repeat protein